MEALGGVASVGQGVCGIGEASCQDDTKRQDRAAQRLPLKLPGLRASSTSNAHRKISSPQLTSLMCLLLMVRSKGLHMLTAAARGVSGPCSPR